MTENNVRYSPHQEYCRKKKPYLQYAPPPLGDIQRPLDPRVTAFREQGQARRQKYIGDYRSDLRDIKFNTKPHYDFYFSAPDQQIVNHLSTQNGQGRVGVSMPPVQGGVYHSPSGPNTHSRTYSGNNIAPIGNDNSWHQSSGHKMKNRMTMNGSPMGYNNIKSYNHSNMGIIYNSPVPPGQAESGGVEMMMDMQYMPFWNRQPQNDGKFQ